MLRGSDRHTAQTVIIKSFDTASISSTERERIAREQQLLSATSSVPNVVRLIGTSEEKHRRYTILEQCPGE